MKKELKERWIEALLSKKYRQGKNKLRSTSNDYCCLGVLCDISRLGHWVKHHDSRLEIYFYHVPQLGCNADAYYTLLYNAIGKELGLLNEEINELCHMNDTKVPFERIALWIEKHIS